MTKYYKIVLLFATLNSFLLISCNKDKLLNPVPQTSISDVSAFDFPYRISNQVLSLYSDLKAGGIYGGRLLVYGEIRGEEYRLEDPNLVTNADVYQLAPTNSASSVVGLWNACYRAINDCNLFIDGMNSKGSEVIGEPLASNYIAEARFIRGVCYYSLLQYYTRPYADGNGSKLGVPLRLTGIKGPGFSDLERSNVADVYNQIISDLDFAESNLPDSYANALTNTTRAHKNTAISFKTRVYLSMQQYDKVITEANKLVPSTTPYTAIKNVPNTLAGNIIDVFKTPYTTAESVFSLPFSTQAGDIPGTQNGLQSYFYASSSGAGSIFSIDTTAIYADQSWKESDSRRTFIFTNTTSRKRYLTKFPTAAPADYSPVIRWAEVLLNLAEAKVRSSNTIDAQAVSILNAIRQRSDPTTTFTASDFSNAEQLISAIMKERRIEFLGEGLRNNDLMRLLQPLPAKSGVSSPVSSSASNYIWPGPELEKSLNSLWVDE